MKFLRVHRRLIGSLMTALMLLWQIGQPLQAATFYWDPDANAAGNTTTGTGLGGVGTWDTTLLNWWDGTSGTDQAWSNATNDTAVFMGSAGGTVTLDAGGITAGALQFKTTGYTLGGGPLTLSGGTVTVDAGAYETISSQINGTAGLTLGSTLLSQRGALKLTNAANGYTGATVINAGTLIIDSNGALGTDASTVVINSTPIPGSPGGSLMLAGSIGAATYGTGFTVSRNLSLLGGSGGGGATTSAVTGIGLVSIGNNTLSGQLTTAPATGGVNGGLTSAFGMLTLGNVSVGGAAAANYTTLGSIGSIGSYSITGVLSGAGSIQKAGGGTLILNPSDASGYSGTIRISRGSVRLTSSASLGTNTGSGTSSTINLNNDSAILEVRSDSFTSTKNIYQSASISPSMYIDHAIGSSSMNTTVSFGTLGYDVGETLTFNGRNGLGLTFSTAPVTTGDGNVTFTNNLNGLLTFTGTFWSNTENTAARTMTIGGTGNTLISGNLTASSVAFDHVLTKTGTGTLTLTGTAATLDGAVNINAGTLAINDFRAINLTSTSVINIGATTVAGTLTFITSNSTAAQLTSGTSRAIVLAGTTGGATINANQTDTDPVLFNSTAAIVSGAGSKTLTLGGTNTSNNEIKGIIQNNSGTNLTSLTKTDAGTWLLSGANTYTGATTISGGTLKLQSNAATTSTIVADTSAVVFDANTTTLGAGGTLQLIGFTTNNATTESFGALTPTAGAGTVMTTLGSGGAAALANISFASLGTVANGTGINFVTGTANANGSVTIGSTGTSTATTLPGNGHLYINGSDFARASSNVMVAPVYGTDAGFTTVNTITAATHTAINTTTTTTAGTTLTLSSVKIMGNTSAFTLASGQTLTISTGGILATGATGASITGGTGITTGGAGDMVIRVDGVNDKLTLSTPITATTAGGLTKNGAGTLIINATNAQPGGLTINEGTVQLLSGTIAANASATTGLTIRQGASFDLNGVTMANTPVGVLSGAGTVKNTSATAATLTIGSANGTGTFSGIIDQTAGVINLTKTGTGAQTWSGLSTYTGVTTIGSTGIVSVTTLANLGTASGIGKGNNSGANQAAIDANNSASLVFNGTTGGIAYTGTASVSIDRLFTMSGGGQISNNSANNSTLIFNKTNAIVFGTTASQTLTLGGSSTGDNLLNLKLTNPTSGTLALSKIGAGLWILGNTANDNTGTTQIGLTSTAGGVLQAIDGSSLSNNSYLLLGGTSGGGVFQSSGNFTRNIGTSAAANTVSFNSTLTSGAVGFAASDSKLTVALGGLGSPTALTWGSGGFMGVTGTSTGAFVLNTVYSLAEIEVRNAINLNGVNRTILVDDNPGTFTDFATITGVISNGTGTAGIIKTGTGMLQLLGASTYNGSTAVQAGTLVVTSLGSSGAGGATSVGTATGGNTLAQAVILGNATTTGGTLVYVGPGETSDRYISFNGTTASPVIVADGTGALVLTNVNNNLTATPTGAKTLTLRGSNNLGNTITSTLSNDGGGGVLSISHDSGGTWILSGNNTYTGGTSVTAGALGAGSDTAFGNGGTLTITNGSIFAAGGDRTLSNPITQSATSSTTAGFFGDYSITLTGLWSDPSTTSSGRIIRNNIVSGKTLTIAGEYRATVGTSSRFITFDGAGDTILSGAFTVVSNANFGLVYAGTGSLTLSNSGNSYTGTTTVSSGTLRVGASNVIPNSAVNPANNLVTINPGAGVTATLDLNGENETINGLTATSAGNAVINNSLASAASLTFGANDQPVTIAPASGGTFTVSNTGGGALSLIKTGSTSLTIPSTGVTLSYTGTTSVIGGTMTIAAALNGTTALSSTGTGSNLNLTGGLSAPASITSVTVGGGAFLSFLDGAGTPLSNLNVLDLGAGSGIATLSLELGAMSDTLTVNSAAVTANTIRLNLSGISGLLDATDYSLLVAPSGLSAGTYVLGSQPGGFSSGFLTVTDSLVKYTTGNAIVGNLIWNNTQGTGSWATNNSGATNFTTDLAGTTDGTFTPGPGTTVIFGTTGLTGGPSFTTSLDANFTVAGLQFTANPAGVTAWTINAGTPATSNLTVKAGGIDVASNAGAATINANLVLGAAQTWSVNGSGANGSSLTIAGIISGNGFALSKTGAGILNLSGVNTFNGGLTIKAGTVVGTVSASVFGAGTITLGDTSGSSSATLQVNTALTYANAIVLAAGGTGTLTIGTPVNAAGVNVTFSGGVTGANNLTINNQSLSGTTTFSVTALNNAGTITNASSSTGTVTISGGIGSNVTQIIENSTTSALTISTTALNVNSGGTTLQNLLGTKVLTVSAAIQGTGDLILKNDSVLTSGVTVSGAVNNIGSITNNGTGVNATSGVTISGIIGTNVTGVVQDSLNSSLQLTGANTFTSGITIRKGILEAATSAAALGAAGNVITLGDTSGSSNASLRFQSNVVPYNDTPVNVVAGSTGTLSILGSRTTGVNTFPGAITLAHDLTIGAGDAGATTAALTLSGGVTGTGNLDINYSATALTGGVTFSTNAINMVGTITNRSNTTATLTISGGVGANVTKIIQNSITSATTISTGGLVVNSVATTLSNLLGTKVLTLSGPVTGTGNLVLQNDSTLASGVTVSGSVNHTGLITNNGVGSGNALLSGIIGANVTGIVQDSAASQLNVSGANTFASGITTATIKKGTLLAQTSATALGDATNTVVLGNTSGNASATLAVQNSVTYAPAITVAGGSTGNTLKIQNSGTTTSPILSGNVTLNHDLLVESVATTGSLTLSGSVTGTGALVISNSATSSGAIVFSGSTVNNTGSITNQGTAGTGGVTISAAIGSAVTSITQNSATSPLTLSGANLFTGPVNLTLGTLNVNNANALGASGSGGLFTIAASTVLNNSVASTPIVNLANNTVKIDGDFTFTGTSSLNLGTGAVNLGTAAGTTRTITTTANTLTLGGAISNGTTANSLIKTGAGTLSLTGASTFSGSVTVNAGTLSLLGANTFTGGVTVTAGTLEFATVSNNGGAASSLGQGTDGISLAGTLSFVGSTNQTTNRAMTLTGTTTLLANGTSGATITYQGAVAGAGIALVLDGTGTGFFNGVFTQTGNGTTADITKNGTGTWTLGATSAIADDLLVNAGTLNVNVAQTVNDDFVITGASTVVNINAAAAFTGDDLFIRGALVKLGINGALTSGMDDLNISVDTASGSILDIAGTTGSAPTDIFLGNTGFSGSLIDSVGGGSIGGTFGFRNGTVSASLTGSGTLTKTTAETVTISGANTGYTGAMTVSEGTLILDYTANNGEKVSNSGAGALTLNGGVLVLNGNNGAATSETAGGLTLNSGSTLVDINNGTGQTFTLNLGGITRAAVSNDGTVRIEMPASGTVTTTTANNVFGILGAYFTLKSPAGVTNFGANDGSNNVVAVTNTVQDDMSLWSGGQHLTDTAGFTGSRRAIDVGSLRFNANATSAVTILAGGTLNVGSGGILMTDNVATGTHAITGGILTSTYGELIFTQESTAQGLSVSSVIGGTLGVTKAGAGMLTLSGVNLYSGPTDIQGGTLVLSGGFAVGDSSAVTLADDKASTLQLSNDETIGNLSGGNATLVVGTVAVGTNTLTINQTATATYAGVITGSGAIVRNGTTGVGNLLFTGASGAGFTGTVTVNGGLLYLEGLGSLNASSITVNKGGSFLISNNGSTRTGARILDTTPIILNSADGSWNGEAKLSGLAIRTDQAATTNETIGDLVFNSGASYLRGDASGTTGIASIIANNFVRNNNATVDARGRAMGATTGDRNQFRIGTTGNQTAFIGTLVGGTGVAGSKNIAIVPWAIGETTTATLADTNMGNSLVTYVSGAGFRALDFTTEYNTFSASADGTENIRESLTGSLTGLAGKTINALVINNNNTAASTINFTGSGSGQTLTVTSGTMLFTAISMVATAGDAMNINVGGFDSGIATSGTSPEYLFFVQNPSAVAATAVVTATITSNLISAADITKSGRGTLVLTGSNTAAGGGTKKTTVNEGVLQIADLDNIGGDTGGLVLAGGTIRLAGGFADDLSSRSITILQGGGTIDTNGVSYTFANSIGGGGAGALTKIGGGTLTLMATATYTGATTVADGKIILNGGADNRISGTAGLVLGGTTAAGPTSGVVQLGNANGAANQTVTELSTSGSGTANAVVGGDAAVSTLTVNQNTVTAYAGALGGAGANENSLSLVKSGVGILTLSGTTLSYTGSTTVSSGTLNITGSAGAALATSGISVAAGATLNLINTAGQTINLGSGTLNLGSGSGATALGLELGSTSAYDRIITTAAATTANTVVLNLTGLSGFGAGTYDLLTAASGLSGATYVLGSLSGPLNGVTLSLTSSDTLVQLSAVASTGTIYWKGDVNHSWMGNNGLATNFTTDLAGTINANATPGAASTVIFSAQNAAGPVISTTLDAAFTINDLQFNSSPSGVTAVSIAAGTGGTLTINPALASTGITVQAGGPASISISAPITLGASQTWTVTDLGTILSSSGGIGGVGNLTKTGNGILTLSGTNAYTGITTVSGGVLQAGATNGFNQLSAHVIGSSGILRLNNFAAVIGSLAGSGTVENGLAGTATRALTVGGDNTSTTFSGVLQDGGPSALSLVKTGTGALTLSGANVHTGATTVSNGILNITGSWTGNAASSLLAYGGSATNTVVNVTGDMTLLGTTGGNVSGAVAVYNQTAGTVTATGNTTSAVYVAGAAGSYGYFNLTGGTYKDSTRFALAVTTNLATQATAVVYIGGTGFLDLRNSEWMLNYSHGQMTVADSGVVDRSGATQPFGLIMNSTTAGGVYGVLNIAGGSFLTTTQPIRFGNNTTAGNGNNNSAFINLAAGTLQVGTVMTSSLPAGGGNNAYLNFAGGTLKTSAAIANWIPASSSTLTFTSTLFGAINNSAVAGAPSFNGGLVFDTNGFNSSFNTPFNAAGGVGVTQANLTVNGGSGYTGAPEVVFSSVGVIAGGTPASGYALISGGAVIGIVITSPGTYTSGTTPTVTLTGGGGTGAAVTVGALTTANTSGGVTKVGAGTLTLSAANTYTGGTTINEGTFALGASNILADAGNVTVNGGTFDISTFSETVATFTLQSGTVTGTSGVLTATGSYELQSGTVNAILAGSAGVNKSTSGTVTINTTNTYSGAVNVSGGTLAFSTSSNLGNASATNTVTLSGGTLSYTGATSLDLGANRVLTVAAGGGTLNVSNSLGALNFSAGVNGASSGSLTKTGAGSVTLSGTTNLNGGAVLVNNGTLHASFGTSGISALTIGATGVMDFSNGSAQGLAGLTGLTLNGGGRIGFELGTLTNDSLAAINAATASGTITLDFSALSGGISATTYNLISAAGGLSGASYILGTGISGWNLVINTTDTLVSLTATPFVPVYWRGGQSFSWNTLGSATANWTTDSAGLVDASQVPQSNNTVIFSAAGAPFTSGTQITTTLDAAFTIDSLIFDAAPSGVTAVTINPGTGGALALVPVSSSAGIEVRDNAGTVTIAAPLTVGAAGDAPSQTWSVSNVGASLVISGNAVFTDTVNKTGAGALTLGGSNTGAGGVTLSAGTLNINSATALGTGAFIIGAGSTINNTSAGSVTLSTSNAQTWNGSFTFTGTQSLNLGAGAVSMLNHTTLAVNGQTLTVGGVITEGTSNRTFTKAGAGTLVLSGNNVIGGGFTLLGGTLNLNNAGAIGTGVFTIEAGTTIDNITGSLLALAANNAQIWNGSFTFTGSSSLNLGSGNVTLGSNVTVTASASTLTIGGVIDDGVNTFGLTKKGTGSLSLGSSNTYGGATVLDQGALIFTATQSLTASTNTLTLGETAGSTSTLSMNLSTASATFGGAALVQTSNSVANTITIGAGQTLRVNGSFTLGYNSAANSTTSLSVTGASGTFSIGGVGAATNANVQIGNGATSAISNAGILDLSGLGTFYANLGTGTFRVGSATNSNGAAAAGSTLILAANSTIIATTITSDSPDSSTVTQAIKLGSGTNVLNATTISIGGGPGSGSRAQGTLLFNGATGTVQIRNLAGTGRAAMNVQNGAATTSGSLIGTVDFTGHSADLLLGTLAIAGRSAGTSGNGTGSFAFDTGVLDVTTINLAARTGTTMTTGSVIGTLTLGGGTVTAGTVTMSTNSVSFNSATNSGDATSTVTISGSGTNSITTMTMGTLAVTNTTALSSGSSDASATMNVSGGTTTIGTLTMGANNTAATTVTANTATSALNISGGAVTVTGNLTMAQTTLRALNAATATISITGGSLTVGGNIVYTDGLGTESNTVTLNGGLLDMTVGSIGASSALITFNAQSGTLRNLSELNGGGTLTKTTSGTLVFDTANSYTGATVVSAGILAISNGGALGGTTNGTSVTAGGTLSMSGDITVTGESLSLTAGAGGSATLNNQSGNNTWTGSLTVDTGSDATNRALLNSDAGKLTVSGNVSLSGSQDFVLRGDGNGEISGQITGSQRLFKSSVGTGTWILSGNNSSTFTGKTSVGNGALQISSESNLGATPGSFVSNQLTLGGAATNGRLKTTATMSLSANRGVTLSAGGGTFETAATTTLTVNSVITGSGELTKEGAGTLVFTAVNTNTGTTTVNAGVLGGTGAVGGDLTVAAGGTLAPGIGAGQFTVGGNLSVSSGGTLLLQLGGNTTNDAGAVRSYFDSHSGSLAGMAIQPAYENYIVNTTAHDSILISGGVVPAINGTVSLGAFIGGYTPVYGDIFDLLDWTAVGNISGISASTFDFSNVNLDAGLGWNTDLFASNGILVVVPEPSRALLLMLGLLGLMIRRRRSAC